MKPSPSQARLLQAMNTDKAHARVEHDHHGKINKWYPLGFHHTCLAATFELCFKNGWIKIIKEEYARWNGTIGTEEKYILSESGRELLTTLLPDDFISKTAQMTASEVVSVLKYRYREPEWLFIPELRMGSGYGFSREQRIDGWALNTYPSKEFVRLAFEIKIYRSDFIHELKQPDKRKPAMGVCNEFYFATIDGVAKLEEIPDECGWIVVSERCATIKKKAPNHPSFIPDWAFIASVFRRIPLEVVE